MMNQCANALTAQFQSIIATVGGMASTASITGADPEEAVEQIQSILSGTILPRRISMRSSDGSRLSVVVKNRRIIAVADLHPAKLWAGEAAPQQTECVADFDTFGAPLASAILALIADGEIEIEENFVTDPPPESAAIGYPTSQLIEHIALARLARGASTIVDFYRSFSEDARARFGAQTSIDVPNDASIDGEWMFRRLAEYREAIGDKGTDFRFVLRDGDRPVAMACASMGGSGCIVVSRNVDRFDELRTRLVGLQSSLQQGRTK